MPTCKRRRKKKVKSVQVPVPVPVQVVAKKRRRPIRKKRNEMKAIFDVSLTHNQSVVEHGPPIQDSFVKRVIDVEFEGKVASKNDIYYRILYDDGDSEEMMPADVRNRILVEDPVKQKRLINCRLRKAFQYRIEADNGTTCTAICLSAIKEDTIKLRKKDIIQHRIVSSHHIINKYYHVK